MLEFPIYLCYRLVDASLVVANVATKTLLTEGIVACAFPQCEMNRTAAPGGRLRLNVVCAASWFLHLTLLLSHFPTITLSSYPHAIYKPLCLGICFAQPGT